MPALRPSSPGRTRRPWISRLPSPLPRLLPGCKVDPWPRDKAHHPLLVPVSKSLSTSTSAAHCDGSGGKLGLACPGGQGSVTPLSALSFDLGPATAALNGGVTEDNPGASHAALVRFNVCALGCLRDDECLPPHDAGRLSCLVALAS